MKNLKTINTKVKAIMLLMLTFIVCSFQMIDSKEPVVRNASNSDYEFVLIENNLLTVDMIRVEFHPKTPESEKIASRNKFALLMNNDPLLFYGSCSNDSNVEIWTFTPTDRNIIETRTEMVEDDDDIKDIILQVNCD